MIQQFVLIGLVSISLLAVNRPSLDESADPVTGPGFNHKAIVGVEKCVDCHKHSAEVWKNTVHYKTITEMPRSPKAKEIIDKMGLRRVKESLCTSCHGTEMWDTEHNEKTVEAGVSCESCHGAGMGWVNLHGEFSGKEEGEESEEEIAKRWRASEAAGMLRPSMIADIARNCVSCHVIDHEELVATGGHTAASEFELLSWSQGNVRHNNFYTNGKQNKIASAERKRVLYLVGMLAEVEVLLDALGNAKAKSVYVASHATRFSKLRKKIISAAVASKEKSLLEFGKYLGTLKLSFKAREVLIPASKKVGEFLNTFSTSIDASTLSGIDALLPDPSEYKN